MRHARYQTMFEVGDKVESFQRVGWVVKLPPFFGRGEYACRAGDGTVFHITELMVELGFAKKVPTPPPTGGE